MFACASSNASKIRYLQCSIKLLAQISRRPAAK